MLRFQLLRWCVPLAAAAWLLAPTGLAAQATLIDEFNSRDSAGGFLLKGKSSGLSGSTLISQTGADIMGQEREVRIEVLGEPQVVSARGRVAHDRSSGAGVLQVATFGNPGTKVTLQYDGLDGANTGGQPLAEASGLARDLTAGGNHRGFLLGFLSSDGADPAGLDLEVSVTNPAAGAATLREGHYIANRAEGQQHFIPFSEFDVEDPESFFQEVDSVTFVFNRDGTPNVDFKLDMIAVVAEPSTWVLLGLGVCVCVAVGYRRRRLRRRVPIRHPF